IDADVRRRVHALTLQLVLEHTSDCIVHETLETRLFSKGCRRQVVARRHAIDVDRQHGYPTLVSPTRLLPSVPPSAGRPRMAPRPTSEAPVWKVSNPPVGPMIDDISTSSPRPTRMPAPAVHRSNSVCAGR